jgi:hypothetical protein
MRNIDILNRLYYDEHNYDSINNLYIKAKKLNPDIKRDEVKEWLSKQQTSQMNDAPVIKNKYLPIYSETPYSFQIDLTFFPRYKKENKGNYILFTAININTRYVYAYYSNNKNMTTIINFMKDMEKKTIINSITADKGSEFTNKEFIEFCNNNDISLYFVKGDSHKLGIINRFHRTLKDKLIKYFIANDTLNWVSVIDQVIDNYNNTINRGIGYAPKEVNMFIENMIVTQKREQTGNILKHVKVYEVGQYCRIKQKADLFDRQVSKYSRELYIINKVNKNTVVVRNIDTDKEIIVKQSNIKIVEKPDKNIAEDRIKEATKRNRQERILRQEGINRNNIIIEPRQRKQTQRLITKY